MDLEELAHDLIAARFKGHGLTRLVEAILKAQGYTTWHSPEGADVDGGGARGVRNRTAATSLKWR